MRNTRVLACFEVIFRTKFDSACKRQSANRAEGDGIGESDEDSRLMLTSGSGGDDWTPGAKDRPQTSFSQPEQSYEAAFNKVRIA